MGIEGTKSEDKDRFQILGWRTMGKFEQNVLNFELKFDLEKPDQEFRTEQSVFLKQIHFFYILIITAIGIFVIIKLTQILFERWCLQNRETETANRTESRRLTRKQIDNIDIFEEDLFVDDDN